MSSEASRDDRSAGLVLLGLALVVGALLRAEYLRELTLSPFGRHLLLDAQWYEQAARLIREGRSLAEGAVYFRPPLYPYLLAGIQAVFGPGLWAPRLVQFALGLGQVAICWRLARLTHGETAARVAAFLAAGYGMFIYFEGEILTTALGTFLTLAAALLFLEGERRGSSRLLVAAGLALGLAATAHATALALAPIVLVWLWLSGRRWLPVLAALAGLALPVGAVTVRNAVAAGEITLIASQGGINFYIGNNTHADGKSALAPGMADAEQVLGGDPDEYRDTMEVAARSLAERETGRTLTAAQVSHYWFGRGLGWIADHPARALALYGRKLLFFWNGYEISNNRDLRDQANRHTPILRLFLVQSAFVIPFAFYGMIRAGLRDRRRLLLVALLLTYGAAIAAFFVCARFRQPALALLLPFTAAGLVAFVRDLLRARRDPRWLGTACAILAALFLVTNARVITASGVADVTTDRDAPFHRYNLAVLYEQAGDLDRAIAEYRAALGPHVRDPRVHLNLGNVLAKTGRADEARHAYREAMRIAPDYEAAVRNNLGILAAQEQDWPEAIRQFERCLAVEPRHASARLNLAATYLSAGRFDDSIQAYRTALARGEGEEAYLRKAIGAAYLGAGLLEDAEREILQALRLAPADVSAVLALGRVYLAQGREDAAERMWAKARELAPGRPAVEQAIAAAKAAHRAR